MSLNFTGRFSPATCVLFYTVALIGCSGTSHDEYAQLIEGLDAKMHVHVDLHGTAITDEDLSAMEFPASIRSMSLRDTAITDKGVSELSRCQTLERLDLSNTKITDAVLETLKKLPNLWIVNIAAPDISPKVFGQTRPLSPDKIPPVDKRSFIRPLPRLPLEETPQTENEPLPGTERLSGYAANVEYLDGELQVCLDFENSAITDTDLESIPLPANVRCISLRGTAITDDGLEELLRAKNLEWLDLRNTQVSDKGIDTLKRLPRLSEVLVGSTKLSTKGKRYLRAALAKKRSKIKYDYSRVVDSVETMPDSMKSSR